MYGMIHRAARQMLTEQFGATVWHEIEKSAGVSEDHFISGASYEDRITLSIIDATSSVTGTGVADLLRNLGRYWIKFAGESAFASVMKMAGDNLPAFISNLNRMHGAIQSSMPNAILPEFALVRHDTNGLSVRYDSERSGLESFVAGLLEGLLNRFGIDGEVSWSAKGDVPVFDIAYNQPRAF